MENVSRAPLFKRCEAQKPADSPCRCQLARRREYSIRNRFASMPVQNRTGTEVLDEKRNEKVAREALLVLLLFSVWGTFEFLTGYSEHARW